MELTDKIIWDVEMHVGSYIESVYELRVKQCILYKFWCAGATVHYNV